MVRTLKTLLSTSALATTILYGISCTPATAEVVAPALKINGFSNANIYFTSQSKHRNGKRGPQPHIALDGSDLYFTIAGQTESGLEYSYRISMQAFPNADPIMEQNYIQLKGAFGIFQIGNVSGPTNTMIKDTSNIVGGTTTFAGGYTNVYNLSAGVINKNDNIGDPGKATKIVYYTPEFFGGFTVGVAYTPNTARAGDDKWNNQFGASLYGMRGLWMKGTTIIGLSNISAGITYKKDFSNKWSITLSAAGLGEKSLATNLLAHRIHLRNARAYQLGGILAYDKLQLAAGYLNNGKSRLPRRSNFMVTAENYLVGHVQSGDVEETNRNISLGNINKGNSGQAFNTGLAYTLGAYKVAGSYQKMNRKTDARRKATGDIYSATLDLVPFQGFKGYVEVDHIRTKTNRRIFAIEDALLGNRTRATGNNRATIFILGTAVSF